MASCAKNVHYFDWHRKIFCYIIRNNVIFLEINTYRRASYQWLEGYIYCDNIFTEHISGQLSKQIKQAINKYLNECKFSFFGLVNDLSTFSYIFTRGAMNKINVFSLYSLIVQKTSEDYKYRSKKIWFDFDFDSFNHLQFKFAFFFWRWHQKFVVPHTTWLN